MKWKSETTQAGREYHLDGYIVRGDATYSTHTGMVFGQFVNDADRTARIREWKAFSPEGSMICLGKLADCKAACERRIDASRSHDDDARRMRELAAHCARRSA